MLPRTKSIFHLGEEEDEEDEATIKETQSSRGIRPNILVGLQILIQEHANHDSNIITKHSMKAPTHSPQLGFLRSCHSCKKKLTPQMDIFMYRGEQGFCSEGCRSMQMGLDEKKEIEASARARIAVAHRDHVDLKARESDPHSRISAAA